MLTHYWKSYSIGVILRKTCNVIMDAVLRVICGDNKRLARQDWRQYRYRRAHVWEREIERKRGRERYIYIWRGREICNKGGVIMSRAQYRPSLSLCIRLQNAGTIPGLCAPRYCLVSIDCLRTVLEREASRNMSFSRTPSGIRSTRRWRGRGRIPLYIIRFTATISLVVRTSYVYRSNDDIIDKGKRIISYNVNPIIRQGCVNGGVCKRRRLYTCAYGRRNVRNAIRQMLARARAIYFDIESRLLELITRIRKIHLPM